MRAGPRSIAAVAATALALLCLAACAPKEPVQLTHAEWYTTQSTPHHDSSEHTQDDPAQLARLAAILDEHGVSGDVEREAEGGCSGGLGIELDVTLVDGRRWHISRYICGQSDDGLGTDVMHLLEEWAPTLGT